MLYTIDKHTLYMSIMNHASHRDLVTSTMWHVLDQLLYQEL